MRFIRGLVCGVLFLALVLLLGGSLVEGPKQDTGPAPPLSAGETALLPGLSAEAETAPAREAERRQIRVRETPAMRPDPTVCAGICRDAGGIPLREKPWYRAAWTACPPEGRFG